MAETPSPDDAPENEAPDAPDRPLPEGTTVGDLVDSMNTIISGGSREDVASRIKIDALPEGLQDLLGSEGLEVGGDEAGEKVRKLIVRDAQTNKTLAAILRSAGEHDIASEVEAAMAEDREVDDAMVDKLQASLESVGEVVRGAYQTLMGVTKKETGPRRELSKEVRQVLRNVGGNQTIRNEKRSVSRNDVCPCGSGKKYKHCCLRKKR